MSNALLSSSMIEREVWLIASQYLPGRDIATIRHEVRVHAGHNAIHDDFEIVVDWGGHRKTIGLTAPELRCSLDDFSERHLAPLVQELAGLHFPAPANEDR